MSRKAEAAYSDELAVALCEQISNVGSVGKACEAVGIARSTFYKWLAANAEFPAMYEIAKAVHADQEFDRLDVMLNADPPKVDGRIDKGYANVLRVQLEALKYKLRVLHPRKYAERVELTGAGGDPLVPPPQEMTPERLLEGARRLAFLLDRADRMMREPWPRPPLLLAHQVTGAAAPDHTEVG